MLALLAGTKGVKLIAESIVDVPLKIGSYSGGPTKNWAEGIGLAIASFNQFTQHLVVVDL
jgi:hypothetical protein